MAFTWSYSGDPSTSNKDAVRFVISDTDVNNQLISDEEINWAVTTYGTVIMAAARIARSLAFKYAASVEKAIGDLRIKYSDRFSHYEALANKLEEDASQGIDLRPNFFVGGTSIDDKISREQDVDRPDPYFWRNQFDNDSDQDTSRRDDPRWYPGGA